MCLCFMFLVILLPVERWSAGVVVCLDRGADLLMAQLMPLPLTVTCFSKIQIGFTFLVPAHPGSPGQRAVKRVCVYVCVCVCVLSVEHNSVILVIILVIYYYLLIADLVSKKRYIISMSDVLTDHANNE